MSSGGLINTCHGCTKDFSEISTAPFDPQIALAVCPTNILLRPTWSFKTTRSTLYCFFGCFCMDPYFMYCMYKYSFITSEPFLLYLTSFATDLFSTAWFLYKYPVATCFWKCFGALQILLKIVSVQRKLLILWRFQASSNFACYQFTVKCRFIFCKYSHCSLSRD